MQYDFIYIWEDDKERIWVIFEWWRKLWVIFFIYFIFRCFINFLVK